MNTELDALRDQVASMRDEITDLRAEVARLRGTQPVVWQQFQPAHGAAGGALPLIYDFGAAQAKPWGWQQPWLNTACANPVPQLVTFTGI